MFINSQTEFESHAVIESPEIFIFIFLDSVEAIARC